MVNPSAALRAIGFILGKNGLKFFHGGISWLLKLCKTVSRIVADEVDVEEAEAVRGGFDEVGKGLGVSGAVVDVFEEDVGKEDFAVSDGEVAVDGGHDLLDRVGGCDGHEFGAFVIKGVVERESEINIGIVAGESFDTRNNADG